MADHSTDLDLRAAVTAALANLERRAQYGRAQREATSGRSEGDDRAAPLEFDERGFPIPRPVPRFAGRVRRLFGDA
jgi:hypothetical protein